MVTFLDDESRARRAAAGVASCAGRELRVDVFPDAGRKLDKQLKYASARGAPVVAIVGEDERARGEVSVRDLQTRSRQRSNARPPSSRQSQRPEPRSRT